MANRLYITDNSEAACSCCDAETGLVLLDIIDLSGIILPYKNICRSEFVLAPGEMRKVVCEAPAFAFARILKGTKCLWSLKNPLISPNPIFYDLKIDISSESLADSLTYDMVFSNTFTPIYDSPGSVLWSNVDDQSYMGNDFVSWMATNPVTWQGLSPAAFTNSNQNLPTIIKDIETQVSADIDGNIDEVITYRVNSGMITYDVTFNLSGTADALVVSDFKTVIADRISPIEEYSFGNFTMGDDPLTGQIIGGSSAYKTNTWNTMDTVIMINLGSSADYLYFFNNNKYDITLSTVIAY
jgi:hypothetical protein